MPRKKLHTESVSTPPFVLVGRTVQTYNVMHTARSESEAAEDSIELLFLPKKKEAIEDHKNGRICIIRYPVDCRTDEILLHKSNTSNTTQLHRT